MKQFPGVAAIVVSCAVLASGCGDVLGILPPSSAIRMHSVPPEYRGWWKLTEACSGLRGSFDDVEWLTVGDQETIARTPGAGGAWFALGNQIVLKRGVVSNGGIVRHEMLHALLRRAGHHRAFFVDACSGIVSCGGSCIEEAGGEVQRDPAAAVVGPESIRVETYIVPDTIFLSAPPTCVTIAVSAQNLQDRHVRVHLAEGSGQQSLQSFGYRISGLGSGGVQMLDSLFAFAPHETRRRTFDCRSVLPSRLGSGLSPGEYEVAGYLRGAENVRTLVIRP